MNLPLAKRVKVHSFESCGTVDGPGVRCVVFMGGCPLRCLYCHNVDMQDPQGMDSYTIEEVIQKIEKNKPYYKATGGGVTFSGGEPMMQPAALIELLKGCQEKEIHTVVDTSLYVPLEVLKLVVPHVDLFMVSLKHFDDEVHKKLIGVSNQKILENIRYLSSINKGLWLRFVVLPGHTTDSENIEALIAFCHQINFQKIELLPYHEMGKKKWEQWNKEYPLKDARPPSKEEVNELKERLEKEGFVVAVPE